ncbi:MAG: MATE family efflux transporter [Lachnospiraceae bacterium]|nr:MATE family efflux transporter [Lachnospiraceae bacterium]
MQARKDEKLGTAPVGKLILSLALPAVAAQLVNVLYNIVDRMYIGHIPEVGSIALTGIGVCFPILTLIAAFSAFIGAGGAPLAAIQLGKKNRKGAEKILGNGFTVLLGLSVILTIFFSIFKEPMLYKFGASSDTIVYALEYLDIYLIGTIFVQLALGLNMFITSQGQAKVAMLSVLIGAVINIVLDPILIFGLDMGVKGAALATIISQACSAIWVLAFLFSKRSGIRIRVENMKPDWKVIGGIAALGVSPFIMQATESLISITLNSGLQRYGGDLYVGSMTILQSVMQLVVIPVMGLTQGTQPIISYNYGAGNKERVKKAFKTILITCVAITTLCCAMTMIFPTMFAKMFTPNEELIALVGKVLPIYMGGIWIFGVQMACQSAFMGMGQAKISLFLALLRKVFLLIPMALILPRFFGVTGIYYSEPIADITAALVTGTLFLLNFKKILSKGEQTQRMDA